MTRKFLKFALTITVLIFSYAALSPVLANVQDEEETLPEATSLGYQVDFEYVRDNIVFQAYSGSLKGSMGTQLEEAGNSLDRAFLLHRLLSAKGYKPQIAQGRLRGTNLDRVVALSQGISDSAEEVILNPASRAKLDEILQDHYWVQIPLSKGKWLDLDPTLPEAVPGKTIAGLRKQLKRVPGHLFQRLEIKVFCEFSIGRNKATSQLIRYIGRTKDIMVEPVLLFFVDRGVHGDYRYSTGKRFTPVLWAGGKIQPAINLKSEANRQASINGGRVPPLEIHRIWVEYILRAPGTREEAAQRLLYSENSPENSRLNELTLISLFTHFRGELSLRDSVRKLADNSVVLSGIKSPEFPEVLSEMEKFNVQKVFFAQKEFAETLLQVISLHLDRAFANLEQFFTTLPGLVTPRLVSVSVDPVDARISTDILMLTSNPVSPGETDLAVTATSFSAGIMASDQEGEVLRIIKTSSDTATFTDSISQTLEYKNQGAKWIALDVNSFYKLSKYRLDIYLLRRLESALRGGKYLVLPDYESYAASGRKNLVWWEVDKYTGTTIGMISSGSGGSSLQDSPALETLAVHYQPAMTTGWTEKLSLFSRELADALQERSSSAIVIIENKKGIILEIYEIISTAISENKPRDLSPSLEAFFSLEGRVAMSSYLGKGNTELSEPAEIIDIETR